MEKYSNLRIGKQAIRTFKLDRHEDIHGKSGTGIVAQGVEFDDGTVAMRWLTDTNSTVLFDSVEDVEKIHGHEGKSAIVWDDDKVSSIFSKVVSKVQKKARVYLPDHTQEGKDTLPDVLNRTDKKDDRSVYDEQEYLEELGFEMDLNERNLGEVR